ncbi:fimbrial major subunit CsuA/B family protein [Duganella sp. FT50W]|uniref:Fimbrial major subunit CsuA/B family protein n=1 Tax=Duganella lactea TaxID=2692173 RepID=A0A6L8MLJ0_9BURK|nr:spore coat protein U domain-containing protein [Duganella lactea]MYM82812.1 fimbrial major subunit CsuA/B family protein [Duganella lactea]
MMNLRRCLLWIGTLLALACGQARADNCSIAPTDITFPTVSSISSSDVYANATFTVTCTWDNFLSGLASPNVAVCLYLRGGSGNTSANVTLPRQLANGAKRVNYNLYTDTSYAAAKVWGGWLGTDTAANVITFTLTKSDNLVGSLTKDVKLYARLDADATLAAMDVSSGNLTFSSAFGAGSVLMRYTFFSIGLVDCLLGVSVAMPFTVSAPVINDCTINVGTLVFPDASLLSSAVRSTTTLTTRCSLNTAYTVTFSSGTTAGNTLSARKMKGGPSNELVAYQISNTLDGASLGDGTGGTVVLSGTGNGATQARTVYGLVPPQLTPSPGDYKDSVIATVTF